LYLYSEIKMTFASKFKTGRNVVAAFGVVACLTGCAVRSSVDGSLTSGMPAQSSSPLTMTSCSPHGADFVYNDRANHISVAAHLAGQAPGVDNYISMRGWVDGLPVTSSYRSFDGIDWPGGQAIPDMYERMSIEHRMDIIGSAVDMAALAVFSGDACQYRTETRPQPRTPLYSPMNLGF
jgi:hypothetical protein